MSQEGFSMKPESLKNNRPPAIPTSEPAKRIATLFHRKLTTAWSEKEVKTFRKLVRDHCFSDLGDLTLVERYYFVERKKGDKGIHRRDLATFLNNWTGELDRARAWEQRRKPVFSVELPRRNSPAPVELTDEQIAKNKAFIAGCMEQLRQKFRPPAAA
jgi:hypothetical protein